MQNQTVNWSECIDVISLTDVGMRRSNNQDSFVVQMAEDHETWRKRGHLLVVADGMGAHAAGELASELAAEGVPHHYYKLSELPPVEAIHKAIRDTNEEIYLRGQANSEFHNMGTTCSCLLLLPQGALAAHVGDSRVYRLRKNSLEQLTFDHSLVWEMRAAGQIKSLSDASGIPKNVITRSLGPSPDVTVDLEGPFPIQLNDTYLLCSDGLTARVEDTEIGIILQFMPPQDAAGYLVDLANVRGGPDNCTLIVANILEGVVVTGTEAAEPLVVGTELKPPKTVNPVLWGVITAAFVLAIGLFAAHLRVPAGISLVVGIAAILIAVYQKYADMGQTGIALSGGKRLGKGPYSQFECGKNTDEIRKIIATLRRQLHDRIELNQELNADRIRACLSEAEKDASDGAISESLQLCWVATKLMLGK